MTTERMNVHQALVELKTLDKRISNALISATWVVTNKHSNRKIDGVSIEEFEAKLKSEYQKVRDLMDRRDAIKRAVVNSNAVTTVEIAGKTYTVAEAIDMKNHGIAHLRDLLNVLTRDYTRAKTMLERANGDELERRADEHVKNMFGNSDMKGATAEVKSAREDFIKAQTVELVDPIGIYKQITEIDEKINLFTTNVDSALSVSNALTIIEIEY